MELMQTPVDVGVVFQRAAARPLWFVWGRRRYEVREVAHAWRQECRGVRAHHYAVSDGAKMYELSLDAQTLRWSLGRVWCRS